MCYHKHGRRVKTLSIVLMFALLIWMLCVILIFFGGGGGGGGRKQRFEVINFMDGCVKKRNVLDHIQNNSHIYSTW
jgi:hypothetical protein